MFEQAAVRHTAEAEERLDADLGFDVVLWELPRAHIRRPDVALYRCAPDDEKPLPASMVLIAVEVVSGSGRIDTVDKRAEYAAAGIPWYWIVRLHDGGVSNVEVLALDHAIGGYRLVRVLEPGDSHADGPIRIRLDWSQLRMIG
jgi:Uma2 family endonuclease